MASTTSGTGFGSYGAPGGGVGVVVLGGILVGGYFFLTGLVAPAFALIAQIVPAVVDAPEFSDLIWDAAGGLVLGALIGWLRYVLRVKSGLVSEIVEALKASHGITFGQLRLGFIALHALVGLISGAIVGCLGLPVTGISTPVAQLLVGAGFFNGGGGPPGGDDLWPLLFALFLLILFGTLVASILLTFGVGIFARSLASGAAGGFGKSTGVTLILIITRLIRGQKIMKDEDLGSARWLWSTFAAGIGMGMLTGFLDALLAIVWLFLARGDVEAAFDPLPKIESKFSASKHTFGVNDVAFSPDGTLLASASADYSIRIWDTATGEERNVLEPYDRLYGEPVTSVAFSPDGETLAAGRSFSYMELWKPLSKEKSRSLISQIDPITGVRFLDAHTLIVVDAKEIKLVELESGTVVRTIPTGKSRVETIRSDGAVVATADETKVTLWDIRTGASMVSFPEPGVTLNALALSPDGKLVATGGSDKRVRIHDTATGAILRKLSGHTSWISTLAFGPDSRRLASGSDDKTVRLWDVATGRGLAQLTDPTEHVGCVAFSRDGRMIAAGTYSHEVWLWVIR